MKVKKVTLILLVLMGAVLLSSCTGQLTGTSWPGISTNADIVYVSYLNRVYAIRTNDGSTAWQYPAKAGRETFFAAPVIADGNLIVGSYQNNLYSLDPNTGNLKWTFSQAKGKYIASPLVVDGKIFAPNGDYSLYALDLNGSLLWKFTTKQALWSQPVSDTANIYQASMDHHVYAIDINTGKQVWSIDLGGAVLFSPTMSPDGVLYVSTLARNLVAISTGTGQIIWQRNFDADLWAQPALANTNLYLGDITGKVYAISAQDGKDVWSQSVNEPVIGLATELPNGIAFATEKGSLIAMTFDGQRLWSRTFDGSLYTGPTPIGTNLAVGIVKGANFLKLINDSGQDVWSYVPPK